MDDQMHSQELTSLKAKDITAVKPEVENQINNTDRILYTACLFLMFLIFGSMNNTMGPSLVHLGYMFDENIAKMALCFAVWGLGYLSGSILAGLIFDLLNHEIQFFVASFLAGAISIGVSFVPNIYWFYAIVGIWSAFMGFLDTTGQPYSVRLWNGHKYKDPIVQLFYGTQTIGGFIGPLIVRPFLVELSVEQNFNGTNSSIINNETFIQNDDNKILIDEVKWVRYPFIINGIAMCCAAFTFLILLLWKLYRQNQSCEFERKKENNNATPSSNKELDLRKHENENNTENKLLGDRFKFFKILLLLMLFVTMFTFTFYVMIAFTLFPTFVLKFLLWPVDKGPLIAAILTGCQALGRLAAIFVSIVLSARTMVFINMILSTSGFVLMLFVTPQGGYVIMCISTALIGLGTSTTFPSVMLWTSGYIVMTGRVGSVFFIAAAIAGTVSPMLNGYLFEKYTPMWLVYLGLVASVGSFVMYICMLLFVKIYSKRSEKFIEKKQYTSVNGNEGDLTENMVTSKEL